MISMVKKLESWKKQYFKDKELMQVISALTKSPGSLDDISQITGLSVNVIIRKLDMLKQKNLIK